MAIERWHMIWHQFNHFRLCERGRRIVDEPVLFFKVSLSQPRVLFLFSFVPAPTPIGCPLSAKRFAVLFLKQCRVVASNIILK